MSWFLRWISIAAIAILCWGLNLPIAQAEVSYQKQTLIEADFAGKDLHGVSFEHSNLRHSNFHGANLAESSFFATNLLAADFSDANLSRATLDTARLTKANLTNAVLTGAFASNIKIEGAIVTGADFTDVLLRRDVQALLCKTASGTNPVTGRETRVTLDCP